nr:SlyX family protein [Brevirhabdus pacifica]
MTDELSQVVADQQDRIARLETRVEMLMRREAGRESDQGGSIPLGDERPPHW